MHKQYRQAFIVLLVFGVVGCGGGGGSSSSDSTESNAKLDITVSSHFSGYSPRVQVSGMSSYAMNVLPDGTASSVITNIPTGSQTVTVTFSSNSLVVGTISTPINASPWETVTLLFYPEDVNQNYDEDSDGWVNYAELYWGSDPNDPFSHPPTGDTRAVINAAGNHYAQSASYSGVDMLGSAFDSGESQSASYSMSGGISVFY